MGFEKYAKIKIRMEFEKYKSKINQFLFYNIFPSKNPLTKSNQRFKYLKANELMTKSKRTISNKKMTKKSKINKNQSKQADKKKWSPQKAQTRFRWTERQNQAYGIFIRQHKSTLLETDKSKKQYIYNKMSKQVRTRDSRQCKSHHQKLIQKYKSIDKVVQIILKIQIQSSEQDTQISQKSQIITEKNQKPIQYEENIQEQGQKQSQEQQNSIEDLPLLITDEQYAKNQNLNIEKQIQLQYYEDDQQIFYSEEDQSSQLQYI